MDRAHEQPWLVPDPWEISEHGEATRRGLQRTPEEREAHRSEYQRGWHLARRYGVTQSGEIIGWFHEPDCTGNHKGNKRCKPMPVVRFDEVGA